MKKLKKYRVSIEYINQDEIDVMAYSKKEALDKAYEELYIDGETIDETVEKIDEDDE